VAKIQCQRNLYFPTTRLLVLLNRGYNRSFIKYSNEFFNREIYTTLTEAKILIEQWRQEYNHVRRYSALRYRPPAPEAIMPALMLATLT